MLRESSRLPIEAIWPTGGTVRPGRRVWSSVPVEGGGGSTEVPETTVGCGGGGREVQGSEEGEGGEEGAGEGKVGCWGD